MSCYSDNCDICDIYLMPIMPTDTVNDIVYFAEHDGFNAATHKLFVCNLRNFVIFIVMLHVYAPCSTPTRFVRLM